MKNFSIEFKWAAVFTVAMLLWMWIEKSAGLHDAYIDKEPLYTNFFAIPAIAIYFLAINDKKENDFHGNMSWRQGFVTGIILSFIIALLSPIVQYATATVISPQYFQNMADYAVSKRLMDRAAAEAYFNLKGYILQGIFGALPMGVLTAAIVAYICQTKNQKP